MARSASAVPETPFRRLVRNFGFLLSGTAAVTLLGIGTLALVAHGLDPVEFGILALLEALVIIVGQLFSFDTPQAVIKFGGGMMERGDQAGFRAVAGLALLLDLATGLLAGLAGLVLVFAGSALIGLPDDLRIAAAFFAATLVLQFPGTPVGILRTLDHFGAISWLMVGQAALKLVVAAGLFAVDARLESYVLGFAAVFLAGNLARLATALLALRGQVGSVRLPPGAQMRAQARAFLRFSAGAWLTASLRVLRHQGAVFVVAAFLGAVGAGLFSVSQRIVAPIAALAEPLRHAIFPELARLAAAGEHDAALALARRTFRYTAPVAALAVLLAFLFGHVAIRMVAGAEYLGAYWALVGLAAARSLYLCTPFVNPLAILYAGMRNFALVSVGATLLWAAVLPAAILLLGIDGAGIGQFVFNLALVLASLRLFSHHHRQAAAGAPLPMAETKVEPVHGA